MNVLKDLFKGKHIIGRGGFAEVILAIHKETGKQVAIKRIDKCRLPTNDLQSKVRSEISIQRRLAHKSIVQILDVHEDHQSIYIILEYCSHGDLKSYLERHNRKVVKESEAATIIAQIIDALCYLHKNNIVHRDLKAANILLDKDNNPMIADFGLSTELKQRHDTHMTMCGTPSSIAPEIWARDPHGLGVDLWGLGVLLYFLLCGSNPFEASIDHHNQIQVRLEDFKIPKKLSVEARDLIIRLLQKDPKWRISVEDAQRHPFLFKYPSTPLKCDDSGLGDCSMCLKPWIEKCQDSSRLTCSTASRLHSRQEPSLAHHSSTRVDGETHSRHLRIGGQDAVSKCMSEPRPSTCADIKRSKSQPRLFAPSNSDITMKKFNSTEVPRAILSMKDPGHLTKKMDDTVHYSPSEPASTNEGAFLNRSVLSSRHVSSIQKSSSPGMHLPRNIGENTTGNPLTLINTDRLLPTVVDTRQGEKRHIGRNGEVVLERTQRSGLKIFHVITKDQQMVTFTAEKYQPHFPNNAEYTPVRNWTPRHEAIFKKLAEFVKLTKDFTVKITYYADCGECRLMESSPDAFTLRFYTGEVVEKNEDSVRITSPNGRVQTSKYSDMVQCCSQQHLQRFLQLFDKCLAFESFLEGTGEPDVFPAVFGKKKIVRKT